MSTTSASIPAASTPVRTDVAGAEDDDLGRAHPGSPAHQYAPPAVAPFEEVGADLRRRGGRRPRLIGASKGSVPSASCTVS